MHALRIKLIEFKNLFYWHNMHYYYVHEIIIINSKWIKLIN